MSEYSKWGKVLIYTAIGLALVAVVVLVYGAVKIYEGVGAFDWHLATLGSWEDGELKLGPPATLFVAASIGAIVLGAVAGLVKALVEVGLKLSRHEEDNSRQEGFGKFE